MMTSPSMVHRTGDTLVIRSLVSGDQLYVNNTDSGNEQNLSEENFSEDNNDEIDEKDLPQCKIRRNYSCSNCNYFTQNPRHFLYHLRDVHKEKVKIYECPNCLYASKHFQKLLRHLKMVHGSGDNIELSEITKNKFKRSRVDHDSKMLGKPPEKKPKPDLTQFDDSSGKLSTDLKCSLCPFTTRHQNQLTKHEKQEHIKTKFFRCSKCSYVTHIKARFTKHVKYHSMPMIKCDLCDFRTPYKWNLDRHYKNHNGNGSFKCSACNFTADIKQSLTVHEMNHHVPPVGQAAGLGVLRRRNKVGASDTTAEEDKSADLIKLDDKEHFGLQIFPQTSTPKQTQDNSKTHPKIKITGVNNKKPKPQVQPSNQNTSLLQNSDKQNTFHMDFINTDDIIHHSNGNIYIKKKCKYCTFKTAWDSEMVRHEQKIHGIGNNLNTINIPAKPKRPIPNLIPIQGSNSDMGSESFEKQPNIINLSDIKELSARAGISSLNDFISLFGEDETDSKGSGSEINFDTSKNDLSIKNLASGNSSGQDASLELKRKHESFFDKLKAKLLTNAGESPNLTCKWCGHESKCLSELAGHQKICGKEININIPSKVFNASSTRCQYCRQRCKSSIDLLNHLQVCTSANQSPRDLIEVKSECSEITNKDENSSDQPEPHPMENVVFVWNNMTKQEDLEDSNIGRHFLEDSLSNEQNFEEINIAEPEMIIETSPIPSNIGQFNQVEIPPSQTKMPTHGTDLDQVTEGKRVFKCPHCTFWASTASRFHVHIVGHLNKKPFECSLCSYRSNWRWDITKHIRLKSVRDVAHTKAKVLMTDETGRRNYSKYNKYLTQMKQSKLVGDKDSKDKMNNGLTQGYVVEDNQEVPTLIPASSLGQNSTQKRPPPPLKPAYGNFYDNSAEKKKNEEVRKTLFKCKKCNFRDASRENILEHVKGHYRQDGVIDLSMDHSDHSEANMLLDDEVSNVPIGDAPFRCGHCNQVSNWKHVIQRHCRLKHHGDVRVVVNSKNGTPDKIETDDQLNEPDVYNLREEEFYKCTNCQFISQTLDEMTSHIDESHKKNSEKQTNEKLKCGFCNFISGQKFELYEHIKMHGVENAEDYINKSNISLLESSNLYTKFFKCKICPFITESRQNFMFHKQCHRVKVQTLKCRFCNFSTSKNQTLQQHIQSHGVDLTPNNRDIIEIDNTDLPPVIETHLLKEVPLVWVSKEGKFYKMYKCRFCPHVNQRKVNIQDHEKMHSEHEEVRNIPKKNDDILYSCPACSYVCNNAGVLSAHIKVHSGVNTQIHCFVDTTKSDEEQITELTNLFNQNNNNIEEPMDFQHETEVKIEPETTEKILYFCQHCPARYLYRKELETHIRFHGSRLYYCCEYCTYTARQKPHLLLHTNVHTESYNLETKKLQLEFPLSKDYPPPLTDVVEGALIGNDPVVVVIPESARSNNEKLANRKFACPKCPTKFYNNDLLSYHLTLHGGKHPYKCHVCDYSAITRNNLEKHERVHFEGIDLTLKDTTIPQRRSSTSQNKEGLTIGKTKSQLKNKRYKCLKCPCTFEKRDQFKIHLTLHGSKQRYQCDKCDYSVKYYANFVQHIKKHKKLNRSTSQNDSEDKSEVMDQQSVLESSLSEPGVLKLSVADKQSLMILQEIRNNQSKDVNLDMDKKLFWCPHCPYTSYRKDAVDNHINRHICVSGVQNNYTCEHCDYTVPQSHFLREHTKIHFTPQKYHQPEAFMITKDMKLSAKKLDESEKSDVDENLNFDENLVIFEECNNDNISDSVSDSDSKQYKPKIDTVDDSCERERATDEVTKIFINPLTHEVIENNSMDSEDNDNDKDTENNNDDCKQTKEDLMKSL